MTSERGRSAAPARGRSTASARGRSTTPEMRFARLEDVSEVVRLAALMFDSIGLDASSSEWQTAGAEAVLKRLGDHLGVFVAAIPGEARLVASVAGSITERLPTPKNPSGRTGYVQWVATEPDWRRQGLGRELMSMLLDWFRSKGVHNVELHASRDGEGVYRSLGFADPPHPNLKWREAT